MFIFFKNICFISLAKNSEDVREWVKQIGFSNYAESFDESRVDGDLLLQLTEEMLRDDIGIKNGLLRRRFMRELTNLKRMADYSRYILNTSDEMIDNFMTFFPPQNFLLMYNNF